jgi:hypothetical protein
MSWSVTINNLSEGTEIPADLVETFLTQHILYGQDIAVALKAAKRAGFKSCVLTGGRTPSTLPDGDEVADISIRGLMKNTDYRQEIKRILLGGADEQANTS